MLGYIMKKEELLNIKTRPLSHGKIVTVESRDIDRDFIASQIAEFERNGGTIEKIAPLKRAKSKEDKRERDKGALSQFRQYPRSIQNGK
jgi:hypothetical protein